MSNYPPGVTGNEFAIAGPDREWEEEFKCTNDEFEYVMISPYAFEYISKLAKKYSNIDSLAEVKDNLYIYLGHLNACINLSSITTEVQYGKCGFSDVVLKQSYRDEVWWDCPQCGKTYEETISEYYGDED